MATSNLDSEYQFLKTRVCIQKRNKKYKALKNAITSETNDVAERKIKQIVAMTKRFAIALALEEERYNNTDNTGNTGNRTTTYCGDTTCQTLPYNRNWNKDIETTRNFIPTAYHILQEYDLLYLKAEVPLKQILIRGNNTISEWSTKAYSDISIVGKKIGDVDERLEYYNNCIDTINQIIALRNYDKDICHNGIDNDDHIPFIIELRQLESDIHLLKPVNVKKLIKERVSQSEQKKIYRMRGKSAKKSEFSFSDLNEKGKSFLESRKTLKPYPTENTDNNEEKEDGTLEKGNSKNPPPL